uniref:Uncharacterized protein n=1 Tax=Sphaerodactylus townsendi TaxID=933632 RepID=A0ACB8ETI5_9SAUR
MLSCCLYSQMEEFPCATLDLSLLNKGQARGVCVCVPVHQICCLPADTEAQAPVEAAPFETGFHPPLKRSPGKPFDPSVPPRAAPLSELVADRCSLLNGGEEVERRHVH